MVFRFSGFQVLGQIIGYCHSERSEARTQSKNRHLKLMITLVLGLFPFLALHAQKQPYVKVELDNEQSITIAAEASVSSDQFTLGEIAQINAQESVKTRLEAIHLGMSPRPGLRRTFTKGQLETRLRQFGFQPKTFTIDMPDTISISRASQEIKADALVDAARAKLKELYGEAADTFELTNTVRPLAINPGEFKCDVDPYVAKSGLLYSVTVRVRQNDKSLGTYRLTFRQEQTQPAATAAAVKSGAQVTVIAGDGVLNITVSGEARSSGSIGETITIYVPSTKKTVKAVVVDGKTVRITE